MRIIEKDFKIEYKGSCFVLYLLKTKKEIKELKEQEEDADLAEDLFKIKGYYTSLFTAIKAALIWRMDKKYPFKESVIDFQRNYSTLKKAIEKLDAKSKAHYQSMINLRKKMYDDHREFLNRIQE